MHIKFEVKKVMVFHVQKRNYLGFFVTCDKTILVRRGNWVGEGAQPSRKFNYHPNEETRKIILKYRNKLPSFNHYFFILFFFSLKTAGSDNLFLPVPEN
jgi:hypothetical protein